MLRRILLALGLALFGIAGAPAQNLNTLIAPSLLSTKNGSVVIASGNTFQTVLAGASANPFVSTLPRNSLTIQNNNATDSCWLFIGAGTATKGTSILLLAGGSYSRYYPYIPSDAIQATCASNSDTLYLDFQ